LLLAGGKPAHDNGCLRQMCCLHDGSGAIRAFFSDREINVASKIVDELAEIITAQKRKLNAKTKLLRERDAEIESLEKKLKQVNRKLKKQTELAADPSQQIDKLKASNKKLSKDLEVMSAKIQAPQMALEKALDQIKQLQLALDDQTNTAARLNRKIIDRNKTEMPPSHADQAPSPTTRLFDELERSTVPPHLKQGGTAGALGRVSRHARKR